MTVNYTKAALAEAESNNEQLQQILSGMNVKSKKKRARKKFLKQAASQLAEQHHNATEPTPQASQKSYDYDTFPVGFLIKTGKQYFGDEDVFRFYYNQNHPEEYKNKALLTDRFAARMKDADAAERQEIEQLLDAQQAK